jgi:hypothetical protein
MPAMSASRAPAEATATATLEAPAPGVDADGALAASWQAVIAAVNGKKRMLGAFLQACRFDGATDRHVVLAMDDLHKAVVDEKENRAIIAGEVSQAFGRPLTVQCVALEGDAPPRPSAADVEPLIDRAIAWFEGEVVDPKPRPAAR